MNNEYVEQVANRLIELMQQGNAPWQKPWKPGEYILPYNPSTGKSYNGMNSIWLATQGYSDPRWMTFKQAAEQGAHVKKGSKASSIVFWKFTETIQERDSSGNLVFGENGKAKEREVRLQKPRCFFARVFNAEQIESLPPLEHKPVAPDPERHARAEAMLENSGAEINFQRGDRAYYNYSSDAITLPERNQFVSSDAFYATALHELGHWTGHETRLNRDMKHSFGSKNYAKEELRAEIASLMLGQHLDIGHDPTHHAAYVSSWIKILRDDPREIFRAAAAAEKIKDYVIGLENQKEIMQEQDMELPAAERLYLDISYQERKIAREAGAEWDKKERSWFVEKDTPLNDWLAERVKPRPIVDVKTETEELTLDTAVKRESAPVAADKIYLAVPYQEKNEAKTAGAKWDKEAKSWFVLAGTDIEKTGLNRWNIDKAVNMPILSVEEQFQEALTNAGLNIENPIMDGNLHRVPVAGDKGAERSGAYLGQAHPAGGYIQNFRTGETINWKPEGIISTLSLEQKSLLVQEAKQRKKKMAQELAAKHEKAATIANAVWREAEPAPVDNAYCELKGIKNPASLGLRCVPSQISPELEKMDVIVAKSVQAAKEFRLKNPDGYVFLAGDLLIPGQDQSGKIHTLQSVNPHFKSFLKGGRKHGLFTVVGKKNIFNEESDKPLIVAEGYATAHAVAQLSDSSVIVAFDSGNLRSVAEAMRESYPNRTILLAADNDHGKNHNVGLEKAKEAALATGCGVVVPDFADTDKGTDWQDYLQQHGKEKAADVLKEKMEVAKIEAQIAADRLISLASTQEQYVQDDPTTELDDQYVASERNSAAQNRQRAATIRQQGRGASTGDKAAIINTQAYLAQDKQQRLNQKPQAETYRKYNAEMEI